MKGLLQNATNAIHTIYSSYYLKQGVKIWEDKIQLYVSSVNPVEEIEWFYIKELIF